MVLRKTKVEVGADGVAIVSINNPPLNLLSVDVMLDLKENIEGTLLRDDVKAIVIMGVNGKFSAGFDVTAFGGMHGKKSKNGFFPLKYLGKVSVVLRCKMLLQHKRSSDSCQLKLSLILWKACHARISTSTAQLGLTELQYGILPGLGGTQRLPRLVGLSKALEMILMSKRVNGDEACNLSLVDATAPADELLGVARQWALDITEYRRPWVISLYKTDKLEPLVDARAILKSARLKVQRQNPNLTHQLVCIDVIEEGIVSGPRIALWKEAEALQELRQSSTCRSLVHFFFAQRQVLKIPGITEMKLLPRKIYKVAVIGGGLMSSEIATMLLLSNFQVTLKEKDEKSLLEEIGRIKGKLQNHVKNGKTTPDRLEKALSLLKGVLDYDYFKDVDLVIEAASEILSLKQEIFANLEKFCPLHCIFTSSGSAFSLKLIGERTKHQNRIVRIHFFCPSSALPLMEIVHMKNTSPQTIVDLIDFGRKMRKTPIIVGDWKGYSVNSMSITYLHAAILLAEGGMDVYQIDQAITSFGMPLGPFRMIDMVGLQVFELISRIFVENLPDSSYEPKLISILQQDDCEGESNGKGFYKYDNCGKASPNPEIRKYIEKARNISDMTADSMLTNLSDDEIVEMILFPALNKACSLAAEGIVVRPSDLDVASVLGMGFPTYRGGIIHWSDSFDSGYVCLKLEKWSRKYGEIFKPCSYLTEHAAKGISFKRFGLIMQAKITKQLKSQL